VFSLKGGKLSPIAIVPGEDPAFLFGYGFNWTSPSVLQLVRPAKRPGDRCWKYFQSYTYSFIGGKLKESDSALLRNYDDKSLAKC